MSEMQKLFGNSYKDYFNLLHMRWCKVVLASYNCDKVCLIGDVKCEKLFYSQSEICIELLNKSKNNKVVTSYDSLPLHSNFFDLVVSFQAHETADDFNNSLEEMSRILSSQGVLVCFSSRTIANNQLLPFCSMSLVLEAPMLYRPKYKNIFNQLFFLEILGPFIMPFGHRLNITIWQKNEINLAIDDSQLVRGFDL